jgi:hypothetical protein
LQRLPPHLAHRPRTAAAPNRRRARRTTSERKGGLRRHLPTLIALLLLAAPATASGHSHYWHKTHPWVGTDWKQKALCVHRHESIDWHLAGILYDGGMQMNDTFQQTYGPWMLHHFGPANRWPINGQLYASWKAWRVRGWSPWPQTARMCGLL